MTKTNINTLLRQLFSKGVNLNQKKMIKTIITKVKTIWQKLRGRKSLKLSEIDDKTLTLVNISTEIVQALKVVTIDTKIDDVVVAILTRLYPKFGAIITTIMLRLEKLIPLWLTQLEVARIVLTKLDETTPAETTPAETTPAETNPAENITNDQLIQIINALNISPTKSQQYHDFATKCLYHLNGGENSKLDWTDCKNIVQEYYDSYVKEGGNNDEVR